MIMGVIMNSNKPTAELTAKGRERNMSGIPMRAAW